MSRSSSKFAAMMIIGIMVAIVVFSYVYSNTLQEYSSLKLLMEDYEIWVGDFPSEGKVTCVERSFPRQRSLTIQGRVVPELLAERLLKTTLMPYHCLNLEPLRVFAENNDGEFVQQVNKPLVIEKTIKGQFIVIQIDYSDWTFRMDIKGKIVRG